MAIGAVVKSLFGAVTPSNRPIFKDGKFRVVESNQTPIMKVNVHITKNSFLLIITS